MIRYALLCYWHFSVSADLIGRTKGQVDMYVECSSSDIVTNKECLWDMIVIRINVDVLQLARVWEPNKSVNITDDIMSPERRIIKYLYDRADFKWTHLALCAHLLHQQGLYYIFFLLSINVCVRY